jgi:nucleoid-associated protein YgaU
MVALISPNAPTKVLQQPGEPAAPVAAGGEATVAAKAPEPAASAAPTAPAEGTPPASADAAAGTAGGPDIAAAPGAPPSPEAAEGVAPAAGAPTPEGAASLSVATVERDADRLTMSGRSPPGATLRLYFDGALVGETTAAADGGWMLSVDRPSAAGAHTVRVDQVKPADGSVVARAEVPFEVLSEADIAAAETSGGAAAPGPAAGTQPSGAVEPSAQPAGEAVATAPQPPATADGAPATAAPATAVAPAEEPAPSSEPAAEQAAVAGGEKRPESGARPTKVRIRRGDDLWTVAQRLYGSGARYTAIYRANRKQIRDPDLIYPGQVFTLPR